MAGYAYRGECEDRKKRKGEMGVRGEGGEGAVWRRGCGGDTGGR